MSDPSTTGEGVFGWAGVSTTNGKFNSIEFQVMQILGWVRTCTIVRVEAVTAGGIGPVGTVDVTPLINMVDGVFNVSTHGVVHGLPYFRLQGGANAVICDPVVGDIGIITVSDKDASVVKSTKAAGAPGSRRVFDLADGVYLGGILNGTPTQYVAFTATGISIVDMNGNTIVMGASGIAINGVLFDQTQHISNFTEATSKGGITVTTHTHTQANDSAGDVEAPISMPVG